MSAVILQRSEGFSPRPRPAAAGEGLLLLQQVSVHRGSRRILDRVDLSLPRGGVTAIVGPSGVGKSTLLATLNGLLRPSSGTLLAAGLGPLDSRRQLLAHRRRTATVFQEHALIGRLSALDNVLLGLADRRHPLSLLPWSRDLREQALKALEEVSLLDKALLPTAQLSGGERQRVGIARALVRQPLLLLADEPFASIDPALCVQMADEFRRLVDGRGLTLVIVLHQLDWARRLADRVIGLSEGRVAFDGSPDEFNAGVQARLFPVRSPLSAESARPL